MLYKKDEVTELGHNHNKNLKAIFMTFGVLSGLFGIFMFFIPMLANDYVILPLMVFCGVITLIGSLFLIIYGLKKDYHDPLYVGCLVIQDDLNRKARAYRALNVRSTAKTFDPDYLYDAFEKSNEVKYIGFESYIEMNGSEIKPRKEPRPKKVRYIEDDNHHFDDILNDEEFFDLMD